MARVRLIYFCIRTLHDYESVIVGEKKDMEVFQKTL